MSAARIAAVTVLGAATICILHIIACGDPSHIYEGRFFVAHRRCLGTPSSIDVVSGDPPTSQCPPTCLAQRFTDGGRSIYVSTMCAPYPFDFDASQSDPLCPDAIDALSRNDTCISDGGSTNPLPPSDASSD